MINALRVTIAGNIPLENAEILTNEEQKNLNIKNYFEDAQIAIKCKEGTFVLPEYKITFILIRTNLKARKIRPDIARKVKRLSIAGNMSVSPAWVVHPDKHKDIGVPQIFKPYDQFVFACDDGLFVTTDFQITMMEL